MGFQKCPWAGTRTRIGQVETQVCTTTVPLHATYGAAGCFLALSVATCDEWIKKRTAMAAQAKTQPTLPGKSTMRTVSREGRFRPECGPPIVATSVFCCLS